MRPGGFRGVFERRDTMIFDTHAHYTSRRFDGHRDEVLDSLPAQGVCGVVECGVDLATSRAALALAETRPWVWAAAGVHPESLIEDDASTVYEFHGDWRAELAAIEPLYGDPRLENAGWITIGPCRRTPSWRCLKQSSPQHRSTACPFLCMTAKPMPKPTRF